jgi:hypothetical protein
MGRLPDTSIGSATAGILADKSRGQVKALTRKGFCSGPVTFNAEAKF